MPSSTVGKMPSSIVLIIPFAGTRGLHDGQPNRSECARLKYSLVADLTRLKALLFCAKRFLLRRVGLARPSHAWPAVTNMAASIASRADLPAQITNWNAG